MYRHLCNIVSVILINGDKWSKFTTSISAESLQRSWWGRRGCNGKRIRAIKKTLRTNSQHYAQTHNTTHKLTTLRTNSQHYAQTHNTTHNRTRKKSHRVLVALLCICFAIHHKYFLSLYVFFIPKTKQLLVNSITSTIFL